MMSSWSPMSKQPKELQNKGNQKKTKAGVFTRMAIVGALKQPPELRGFCARPDWKDSPELFPTSSPH